MRIYVGNLTYRSSEQDVRKAFEAFGTVTMCQLAIDPQTGRSAGFAYVEIPNEEEAQHAIARLNGKEINSRVVTVCPATMAEAPDRPSRPEGPSRRERAGRYGRGSSDRDSRRARAEHARDRRSDSEKPRGDTSSRTDLRARSDARPALDNPWTRRRPPQGK